MEEELYKWFSLIQFWPFLVRNNKILQPVTEGNISFTSGLKLRPQPAMRPLKLTLTTSCTLLLFTSWYYWTTKFYHFAKIHFEREWRDQLIRSEVPFPLHLSIISPRFLLFWYKAAWTKRDLSYRFISRCSPGHLDCSGELLLPPDRSQHYGKTPL